MGRILYFLKKKAVLWLQCSDYFQEPIVGAANHQLAIVK